MLALAALLLPQALALPPAAGKKPHIAFILLDDYGYAPATRLEAYAPTA